MPAAEKTKNTASLAILLPGLLVAATGVGAGDLATASLTGSLLGVSILWAVVLGGWMKFVLTEGLARWQLATGQTFLEGVAHRLGRVIGWLFLPYLLLWSFFVGSALMGACGVTLHAMIPVFSNPVDGKIWFGILASLAGLALVLAGGFPLFEKVMGVCVAIMFFTVVLTAVLLWPGTREVLSGMLIPVIPDGDGSGVIWTIALMGGVGGTLTILCYGYWIREKGRSGPEEIKTCRIDLAVGYFMTVLFGLAMVIIGSTIKIEGQGAGLLTSLARQLETPLGPFGRWLFLVGAFGAVFSSLLGVWQSAPYLFADVWDLFFTPEAKVSRKDLAKSPAYRIYLWAITLIPMAGLFMSFKDVQKFYAVIGATFIPLLALGLLILNGRRVWVGKYANRPLTVLMLLLSLVFFGIIGFLVDVG
jgi:Mn2+/Fe2+ NRAMP family transporter